MPHVRVIKFDVDSPTDKELTRIQKKDACEFKR